MENLLQFFQGTVFSANLIRAIDQVITSFFWSILYYWWIILPPALLWILYYVYMDYIQTRYRQKWDPILLQIKVPEENLKTPKAAEQIIYGLHGIQSTPNLIEKYIEGKTQEYFSLEIVGIDGKVGFFIWTPKAFKNLVEAHVYAQYPEAEIREVEDYTKNVPDAKDFLEKGYDNWSCEIMLTKDDGYPINTYVDFEDKMSEEGKLIDPLAAITEVMSGLREGEQMWLQIIIQPILEGWQKEGEALINKILGIKMEKPTFWQKIFGKKIGEQIKKYGAYFMQAPFGVPEVAQPEKGKEIFSSMLSLTPGQYTAVMAIQRNISKIGFNVKMRFVYLGKKEVFNKARVGAFWGGLKQYGSLHLNAFKPHPKNKTKIDYFMVKRRLAYRKRKNLARYKKRDFSTKGFVFNTEEIASLWHMPIMYVKAPTLERAKARMGEPPPNLPIE